MTTKALPTTASPGTSASAAPSSASFDRSQRRSAELEAQIAADPSRFRVLTGDRPTGPLHIGHYFGTLHNRVRLQRAGVEVMLLVADYQVITDRDSVGHIDDNVTQVVLDNLAVGIDLDTTIFTHSAVPALNQLLLPFLSLTTVSELQRNPTVKDEATAAGISSISGLMLTYPVHQAADILFGKANLVPVGKDQLPHVEATRLIARRFNDRYAGGRQVFPEPDALLSDAPLLLGTDGRKMSKSAGNTVELRLTADETARRLRSARTDSQRRITYDPENRPEVSNLVLLAALCQGRSPVQVADEIGDRGSAALKAVVTEAVNEAMAPIRARRAELAADRDLVQRTLRAGNERANALADATLDEVRAAMQMVY